MAVTIRVKRGTATQWAARTTPLLSGEIGYDLTNKITKIGDGTTLWGSLPSIDSSGGSNTGDVTFNGVQVIGAGTASGDGSGLGTLELVPDGNITSDQYLIIDPTAPNHIHIRAGGTQDASNADLFLGGERNNVLVSDNGRNVSISTRPDQVINSYTNQNTTSDSNFVVSSSANIYVGDTFFYVEGGDTFTVASVTADSPSSGLQTITAVDGTFVSGGNYVFIHEEPYNNSWIFDGDGYLYGPGEGVLLLVEGIYNAKSNLTLQALGSNNKVILDGQNGEFINDASDPENQIATLGDITAANEYTDQAISSLSNTSSTTYVLVADVGQPDGIASLDANGKIPDTEIPDSIARDSELKRTAVQWTSNHYQLEGGVNTRYLAGDVVYDGGNLYVANFDNESLPTSNTQYWSLIGAGNRLNIDGRDIPNILWDNLGNKPTLFDGNYNSLSNTPTLFSGSYDDLTDKPTIPDLTGYATETYVNTAVSNLVDSAPETLNTLNELAAALGDDANYASTITTALSGKLDTSHESDTTNIHGIADTSKLVTTDGSQTLSNKTVSGLTLSGNISVANDTTLSGAMLLGGSLFPQTLGIPTGTTIASPTLSGTFDFTGVTVSGLTKSTVGLSNVDNTSDSNKPVSTATQTALNAKLDSSGFTYASITIPVYSSVGDLPSASDNHGRWAHVHGEGAMYFAHGGSWYKSPTPTDMFDKSDKLVSITQNPYGAHNLVYSDLNTIIEMSNGGTVTINDSGVFPVGFTVDVLQTGSSQVTIAGNGFTPNATPGLKLRAQWSSATLVKRGLNSWVVMGDLSA